MVPLDVGLFTGFAPDEDSLADIRAEGKGFVNRVDADDRKVVFYLENTDSSEACVIFQATKMHEMKNLQAATSTVQAYYHPERKGTSVTDSGDIGDYQHIASEEACFESTDAPARGRHVGW